MHKNTYGYRNKSTKIVQRDNWPLLFQLPLCVFEAKQTNFGSGYFHFILCRFSCSFLRIDYFAVCSLLLLRRLLPFLLTNYTHTHLHTHACASVFFCVPLSVSAPGYKPFFTFVMFTAVSSVCMVGMHQTDRSDQGIVFCARSSEISTG